MPKPYQSGVTLTLLTSLLVWTNTACGNHADFAQSAVDAPKASVTTGTKMNAASTSSTQASTVKTDPYKLAVERAASAYTMSKSAQSRDDWRLVTKRWQQAIELMRSVSASSSDQAQRQQKLVSYQQNLAYAQRQANRPTTTANPSGVIVLPPPPPPPPQPKLPSLSTSSIPVAAAVPQVTPQSQPNSSRVFYAPIVRREGSTPVISVLFNQQPFDMVVDTGASGTVITPKMASSLGVVPVAKANVDTASQRGVAFPMGYVQSIEVGGAVASNVLVAVAGPELAVGLLGHDFFGNYDVTIRQNQVEFRER